ncbi:DMT family transporter [Roseovarius sp. S1116L3]|uniref:DMT family transporter n=1 Tax=Roseovarius roseus TaxID=3342636 RepID=UPI003727E0B7
MILPSGNPLAPVALTVLSAILWGLWWIPIRWLESLGLTGAQASFICNFGAVITLVVYMLTLRFRPRLGLRLILGAGLIALAFSFYSVALTLSDVVRVILLFYLAPGWSKIIEWAFLKQPWRRSSSVTLLLSLLGAYLVLGGDLSLASLNIGDVLALIAGVMWAVGATLVFTGPPAQISALTLATVLWAALQSAAIALLMGDTIMAQIAPTAFLASLLLGALYLVPLVGLTLWGAARLPPALLSFLFTLEILSGVLSGALLLDEPFGLYRASGGLLIFGAAIFEAVMTLRRPPARHL